VANVTEARMEAYLRAFQDEYLSSVERYLPSRDRDRLVRYSLLPAAVTGYVSTQFGAGYEYGVGDDTISIRRSSKRIEELFVGALCHSGPGSCASSAMAPRISTPSSAPPSHGAESCLGELAGARRGTYPWRSESV
jgi:hypothetical protein